MAFSKVGKLTVSKIQFIIQIFLYLTSYKYSNIKIEWRSHVVIGVLLIDFFVLNICVGLEILFCDFFALKAYSMSAPVYDILDKISFNGILLYQLS